jgi:hypothetical protein
VARSAGEPITSRAGDVTVVTSGRWTPGPTVRGQPVEDELLSCLCTQDQLESTRFRYWAGRLGEQPRLHRLVWEYCYIAEALQRRGVLSGGCSGLGFAVGTEPLPSLFASLGARVVATDVDLGTDDARDRWFRSEPPADDLHLLNRRGLCSESRFRQNCSVRSVDPRRLPDDLTGFDFLWSSSSVSHLGTIEAGADFVVESMRCLARGGVAVHTLDLNCSSNEATLTEGETVLFRRRDVEALADRLRRQGHRVTLDFTAGSGPADHHVDLPPYPQDVHLKLMVAGYVVTSFGLTVTAAT